MASVVSSAPEVAISEESQGRVHPATIHHDERITESGEEPLPTQDQLFSVFMAACAARGVRKPPKGILALLEPVDGAPRDPPSWAQAFPAVIAPITNTTTPLADQPQPSHGHYLALAERKTIPMGDPARGSHWGNQQLLVLLDVLEHCPRIEEIDWSSVRLYDADAYKLCISGNDLVLELCKFCARHPGIQRLKFGRNPIGSVAAHHLIELCKANGAIVEIDMASPAEHIEPFVLMLLQKQLLLNQKGSNANRPRPYRMSAALKACAGVDRKTSMDRRLMRLLLVETGNAVLSLAPENQDYLVLKGTRCTFAEALKHVRGLRGDEHNVYIVESGELVVNVEGVDLHLTRGDVFGDPSETVLYTAGAMTVKERGHVFTIPHDACQPWIKLWDSRCESNLPLLRHVPALQGLPLWVLIKASHETTRLAIPKGTIVIAKGSPFQSLLIVISGYFVVRGQAAKGRENVTFTRGDLFGQEAAVSRHGTSTVDIKAMEDCEVLVIPERVARRHILPTAKTVLALLTKSYAKESTSSTMVA